MAAQGPNGPICSGCSKRTLRLRVTRGSATEYVSAGYCDDCAAIVTARRVLPVGRAIGQSGLFTFDEDASASS